ncbi:serine/threonine-protein kinase [Mycobacterium sp. BMJ-28]
MEGTPFGRYQLIELLGRGGMGEVWRAYDTEIDRTVALKMLLPHFARDPDYEKRFRREARAAARLDDPHVVPIHDVGEIDGRLYVTMRLINGVDLQTLINNGPMEPKRAVFIIGQIAAALHVAHQAGLVHRDVKPSNILLADNDFAYLIDFGIARATTDTALTSANTTIGTWAYMAPERFRTGESGPSSDIYALTCVLYQCLTGDLPFPGDTLEQVAVSHMVMPPPRPSHDHATVPAAMDQVIATGLAKQPTDRFPTTVDLAGAAQRALTHPADAPTQAWQPMPPSPPPPQRKRTALIATAVAAVILLVAGGVVAAVALRTETAPTAAPSAPTTSTAPQPPPFTGVYQAVFSAPTLIDGGPLEDARPSTAMWAVRSACRPDGCVAIAERQSGDGGPPTARLEFDQIDGNWVAVALAAENCHDVADEIWYVFTLRERPDGRLTGDYTGAAGNSCSGRSTITFNRTTDVDPQTLPDPAELPPRVVSPAEALRGSYRSTRTFRNGLAPIQGDYTVKTDCLRTGDRCMSYFHKPEDFRPLLFAGGTWSLNSQSEGRCDGKIITITATGQYPMPQPQQNPINLLLGHGDWEESQPCAMKTGFDETFTRTGD